MLLAFRRWTGDLPAVFWFLWVGTLVNRLGTFVVVFLSLYLTSQRSLSVEAATLVVSGFGAGSLAAQLGGGTLADGVGRRPTILISLFSTAAVMLLLPQVTNIALIGALVVLLGFCTDLYRPAVSATIADVVPPEQRQHAYALLYWAINIGFAVAPLLAGALVRTRWEWLFILDAATCVLYGCIVWWRVPETRPEHKAKPDTPEVARWAAWREVRPVMWAFTGLLLLFWLPFSASNATLGLDMSAKGLSEGDFGAALAVNGVLIVLVALPVAGWVQRLPATWVLATAAVLSGVGFALHWPATTTLAYGIGVAVWTLGELTAAPVIPTVVAALAPAHRRGLYQGIQGAAGGLASFIGPAVGGQLLGRGGSRAMWLACLFVSVAAVPGFLALRRYLKRG